MPRKARKHYCSEFFHVIVQGINREKVFKTGKNKQKYLSIFKENYINSDVKIISYCMMDNHAHFVLHSEHFINISKMMHKINLNYGMYYNHIQDRCGYVFRDRFKAEEITNREYLLNCIKYVHNNPVKAGICEKCEQYKYSSFLNYKNEEITDLIDLAFIKQKLSNLEIEYNDVFGEYNSDDKFIEYYDEEEVEKMLPIILSKCINAKNIKSNEIKNNREMLKEISYILNYEYKVSQKKIAEIFEVSKVKINRLLNQK